MKDGSHFAGFQIQALLFFLLHMPGWSDAICNPNASEYCQLMSEDPVSPSDTSPLHIVTHLVYLAVGWGVTGILLAWENMLFLKRWQGTYSNSSVSASLQRPPSVHYYTSTQSLLQLLCWWHWDGSLLTFLPLNLCFDFSVSFKCLLWLNLLCRDYNIHVKFSSFA